MKRVAVYGGSFNPPGIHHRLIVLAAAEIFDEVVILPCGPRPDKSITGSVDASCRAAMAVMTFGNIGARTRLELFDLQNSLFTPNCEFERIFGGKGKELWHVVGSDLVRGGARGESLIHRVWRRGAELWRGANFAVVLGRGLNVVDGDLPPRCITISFCANASSSDIRDRVFNRADISGLVVPEVAEFIERHELYRILLS